ncbi:MAG: MgtC/SapB family protein [Waddliaceae bacterium]|jgi:putative Mg2+ transporter-C (MgtC) family protein|nr:MgtC/SapB family protein [Waddliaceae bacterium]MBT3579300.1 MgtC/SapB family protein [Waddliaceae bacterium]MBT4444260.1 MgtC/SapB family protein [Waddliaceae bacterium]MBT6928431.1 MgtC/SapB family protein [Waddliaceae bacterium]MBT7264077.1 MgtC/SapB family protein [Waddliaceae bacterium]
MEAFFSYEVIGLLGRLFLAAFLAAVIGLERDIHGRAAGLRTHLLVGLGSGLFMIMSLLVANAASTDPGRIAAQIVTGIGFLGAGAIMKEGFSVRGLTTAACFWIVAAIGMAAGAGYFSLAICTTIIALLSLSVLRYFDKMYKKESYRTLTIKVPNNVDTKKIIDIAKYKSSSVLFVDINKDYTADMQTIKLTLRIFHRGNTDKISRDIISELEKSKIPIKSISWVHGKLF